MPIASRVTCFNPDGSYQVCTSMGTDGNGPGACMSCPVSSRPVLILVEQRLEGAMFGGVVGDSVLPAVPGTLVWYRGGHCYLVAINMPRSEPRADPSLPPGTPFEPRR